MKADSDSATDNMAEFAYHQAVGPIMWVLLALSVIELFVAHFLISFFNETAAIIVSVLTLLSIVWLVRFLLSLGKMPVLLSDNRLTMRLGNAVSIDIDRDNIAGTRANWSEESLKADKVLRLSMLAYPNVVIDLKKPVAYRAFMKERTAQSVAHRLDDADGFYRALKSRNGEEVD